MKRLLLPLLALTLFACAPQTQARPLYEYELRYIEVNRSTHIFEGVVRKINWAKEGLEIVVEVGKVLKPVGWKPLGMVKVLYENGLYQPRVTEQQIGERLLFLTSINFSGEDSPKYGCHRLYLKREVAEEAAITALVKPDAAQTQKWGRLEWLAESLKVVQSSDIQKSADLDALLKWPVNAETGEHRDWLRHCVEEIEALKIGDTRQDVNRRFLNIGLTGVHTRAIYRHRECPFLVFEVEYAAGTSNQPLDSFKPNDRIAKISKPKLEWPQLYPSVYDQEREKRTQK